MSTYELVDAAGDERFGAGGDEPYRLLLGQNSSGRLVLRRVGDSEPSVEFDVDEWRADASLTDETALDGATGPVLDVGCGPGRMVRAAANRALPALGIDVSAEAVAMTGADGTPVLLRSVFDRLPLEGRWHTVLLMDGNVGIGGDPEALLSRCAELLRPGGGIVVEVDAEPDLLDVAMYTTIGEEGQESAPFPWARIGHFAIDGIVRDAGLVISERWVSDGRHFVRVARA